MPQSHSDALYLIIGFVAFLFVVIIGTLVASQLKSRKKQATRLRDVTGTPAAAEPATGRAADQLTDFSSSTTVRDALSKIRNLFQSVEAAKNFDEMEEVLYSSDLGPQTIERVLGSIKDNLNRAEQKDSSAVRTALRGEFEEIFQTAQIPEPKDEDPLQFLKQEKPAVWLIVGVNGAGKTTSIGKVAAHLAKSGKKVLVAAGDTFRAAAESQLKVWTERAQVEIFSPEGVKDPSAVAFDAVSKGKAGDYDVVIVDTAGRLHTQAHLMEELKKMKRVIEKAQTTAPHEILIVLDANSGQNALMQAKEFNQALGLTGVILTKMDGSAKGGVAVGIANELKIPIRMIGVGEKIGDLKPFSAQQFIESIL